MSANTLGSIKDFLKQKRLALVGVSHRERDFSRGVFRELRRRGYSVIPVNPNLSEVEGQRCFPHVQDITPPVDAAVLMTSPAVTEEVVRDCKRAGVTQVWMHQGAGRGAANPGASDFCRQHGIRVIEGECLFMFLPRTPLFHRLHGCVKKLMGKYPH
jgi:predicted CoA-binding protein